ncbi:MAG: 1-deoxy-D-xylulose-5-phosphate synthase N-terminal domain-containing protein [Nanoarchaeota archaeon]|nr:1-deoxy-D-xylulose-5-phosphate synthase N-terminal domain-containing protein [Nanoarchaeota archaeon]
MDNLKEKAKELRKKVLDLSKIHGDAHLGGSFSEIEILISLFEDNLKKEDKFILSKGHCPYPLYILLKEKSHNPNILAHPDLDEKNGIYATTGSLGHGFPIGVGMALARKLKKQEGRIYVLIGDGECQEGTTWESADIASYHKLDNLCVIIDHNKLQALDKIKEVSPMNLSEKFKAFGWHVAEIDGHNFSEINNSFKKNVLDNVLDYSANPKTNLIKPYLIIAHTIKGKGISYMENNPKWHARFPNEDELKKAYNELR